MKRGVERFAERRSGQMASPHHARILRAPDWRRPCATVGTCSEGWRGSEEAFEFCSARTVLRRSALRCSCRRTMEAAESLAKVPHQPTVAVRHFLLHALSAVETPSGPCNHDDRHIEMAAASQRLKGREDLLNARSPVAPKRTHASDAGVIGDDTHTIHRSNS